MKIFQNLTKRNTLFSATPTFPPQTVKNKISTSRRHAMKFFAYPLLSLALTLTFATPTFAAVRHTGKAITNVTVVTETNLLTTNSTSFVNLPGGAVTIVVPAGNSQLVQATFSSESYCFWYDGAAYQYCLMQILADGIEMLPASGGGFVFDTNGQTDDGWEAHAMARTIVLGPGTHIIRVQWAVSDPGLNLALNNWTLTVTQYANGK
jgi:hypothetical protein